MLLFFVSCVIFIAISIFVWKTKGINRILSLMLIFFSSNMTGGCGTVSLIKKINHTPTCAINSRTITIKKDTYSLHREAGKKLPGITLVEHRKQQKKFIQDKILVPLENKGYSVQKMNYGTPFVHKKMHSILTELQQRFEAKQKETGLHDIHFVITSAYRTTGDQKRLQKVNRNATKSTSSHSYGASVDIAKLSGKGCKQAVPLFQELLKEMQEEKKLYLCPESRTIHITARVK